MTPERKIQAESLDASGLFDGAWYGAQYPDVAMSGLPGAEHYLKYGARMGRDPGPDFETGFYLAEYDDVRTLGENPLLHYLAHGRAEGRVRTWAQKADGDGTRLIARLRQYRQDFGFTEAPVADLQTLAEQGETAFVRGAAARELALWTLRDGDYHAALNWLVKARGCAPDQAVRRRLNAIEMICFDRLAQEGDMQAAEAARAAFNYAGQRGDVNADTELARVNFEPNAAARCHRINRVMRHYTLSPLALMSPDQMDCCAFDRLCATEPLPAAEPPNQGAQNQGTQDQGPKVSVLLAVHNGADTIATALRSLQAQSWGNLDILVMDDASTDATPDIVAGFVADDARIRLIRLEQNVGAYVARNHGLETASGEYVTLMDADDWAHPLRVETQMRFLMAYPDVMGCTSEQVRVREDLHIRRWTGEGQFIFINTASFMFRRVPVQDQFGGWDTVRISADNELIRRIRHCFGGDAVRDLATGPLTLQRDTSTSAVANSATGITGFLFGARREYRDAQIAHHGAVSDLKYDGDPAQRAFPAPAVMRGRDLAARHIPVVLGGDFRRWDDAAQVGLSACRFGNETGIKTAIFEMLRYDLGLAATSIHPDLRAVLMDGVGEVLTYGETVSCDMLIVTDPEVLRHAQRYLPRLSAAQIRVIHRQDGAPADWDASLRMAERLFGADAASASFMDRPDAADFSVDYGRVLRGAGISC
jgi:glycosyltransferase involved in cell wall biosynthesis